MFFSFELLLLILFSPIYSAEEYGYFFDGFDDHISIGALDLEQSSENISIQFWFRNDQKLKFLNLEQCLLSHGSWEERYYFYFITISLMNL